MWGKKAKKGWSIVNIHVTSIISLLKEDERHLPPQNESFHRIHQILLLYAPRAHI